MNIAKTVETFGRDLQEFLLNSLGTPDLWWEDRRERCSTRTAASGWIWKEDFNPEDISTWSQREKQLLEDLGAWIKRTDSFDERFLSFIAHCGVGFLPDSIKLNPAEQLNPPDALAHLARLSTHIGVLHHMYMPKSDQCSGVWVGTGQEFWEVCIGVAGWLEKLGSQNPNFVPPLAETESDVDQDQRAKALSQINPTENAAQILIEMCDANIDALETRKSQQKIVDLIGRNLEANNFKRAFGKLKGLDLVETAQAGGFFLTPLGKAVAKKLTDTKTFPTDTDK